MKKVLIIEDNDANLYLIQFMLNEKGYNTVVARDGLEGIAMAKSEDPDIILMDIQLPKMNGYDATRKIRQDISKQIPIIAITSFAMAGDRQKCLDAGCTDYLEKPIDPSVFLEVVTKYLEDK